MKQAQIPYGSQSYTSPGIFSFTAPSDVPRITARGGGGGGERGNPDGGDTWGQDASPGSNGSPMESTASLPSYGVGGYRVSSSNNGKPGTGGAMIIEWGGDIK